MVAVRLGRVKRRDRAGSPGGAPSASGVRVVDTDFTIDSIHDRASSLQATTRPQLTRLVHASPPRLAAR
jgi:hypothetical protein